MNMNFPEQPVDPPFGYYGDETEEDFMIRTGYHSDGRKVSNKDMEYLLYG